MSQNEWKTTEIRASKVGNFSPFSCPGLAVLAAVLFKCQRAPCRSVLFVLLLAALAAVAWLLLLQEELSTPWGSTNAIYAHGALLLAGLLFNLAAGSRRKLKNSPGSFLGRKDNDHIL